VNKYRLRIGDIFRIGYSIVNIYAPDCWLETDNCACWLNWSYPRVSVDAERSCGSCTNARLWLQLAD